MYTTVARFEKAHKGNGIWSLASREGALVSGSIDGSLNMWKVDGTQMSIKDTWWHSTAVTSVSLGGDVLAASLFSGSVLISHAATGEVLDCIDLEPGEAGQVAVRVCGEVVAIAAGPGGVLLYHVPSRNRQSLSCAAEEDVAGSATGPFCSCVAFDAEGAWLVAGCRDGTVHLWSCSDAGTGTGADTEGVGIRAEVHGRWRSDFAPVLALDVDPAGRALACAHDSGLVLLWTLPYLELQGHLLGPAKGEEAHNGAIAPSPTPLCLRFAPEAPFLAVSYDDGKVRLFHHETWELVWTFSDHARPVYHLLFLPAADRLLSAGDDGALVAYSCNFPASQH